MFLAGTRLLSRGDKVLESKCEDSVGDLAVFNISDSFKHMLIDTLGKCYSEVPTTLAM